MSSSIQGLSDWGNGMFETREDRDMVDKLDEEFAMRELNRKVNGRAGIKDKLPPNRFSLLYESCYHVKSYEIVRKYLNSGALKDYCDKLCTGCWAGDEYRRFCVLAACAMTHGCILPDSMRKMMTEIQNPLYQKHIKKARPDVCLKPLAFAQLKKASAAYKDGEPYDFGQVTLSEASAKNNLRAKVVGKLKHIGYYKILDLKLSSGQPAKQIEGPPSDEETHHKATYPNHLCASCGATQKKDGQALDWCARCKDRKYCSKECQKRNWQLHKVICSRPTEEMEKFMQSIMPLSFPKEEDFETICGDTVILLPSGEKAKEEFNKYIAKSSS